VSTSECSSNASSTRHIGDVMIRPSMCVGCKETWLSGGMVCLVTRHMKIVRLIVVCVASWQDMLIVKYMASITKTNMAAAER
jgi:Fe-S-cluster-containing dehydrogenase component